jgi:hypothetical protein
MQQYATVCNSMQQYAQNIIKFFERLLRPRSPEDQMTNVDVGGLITNL